MSTIIETTVYKFHELPVDIQKTVIEKECNINTDCCEWWDSNFDDFKEIGKILGITISTIYFSGFSSQGDGACFVGGYEYKKESCKKIREYAPIDTELHSIADELFSIQKRNFFDLAASVKHSGHYYHSLCTFIDVYDNRNYAYDMNQDTAEDIKQVLRDFMGWMYKSLEKQDQYLTSEEAIKETIKANDYDFTIEGDIY